MQRILTTLVAMLAVCTTAVANVIQQQERTLEAFNSIASYGSFQITVTFGNEHSVSLSGKAEDLADVETVVKNNALAIRFKNITKKGGHGKVAVQVSMATLKNIALYGSGYIKAGAVSSSTELNIGIYGSGLVQLDNLAVNEVNVSIAGSGDVMLQGATEELNVQVNGSGKLDAKQLACSEVNIAMNGSGNVTVQANKELNASINGSGKVRYTGTTTSVNVSGSKKAQVVRI